MMIMKEKCVQYITMTNMLSKKHPKSPELWHLSDDDNERKGRAIHSNDEYWTPLDIFYSILYWESMSYRFWYFFGTFFQLFSTILVYLLKFCLISLGWKQLLSGTLFSTFSIFFWYFLGTFLKFFSNLNLNF